MTFVLVDQVVMRHRHSRYDVISRMCRAGTLLTRTRRIANVNPRR